MMTYYTTGYFTGGTVTTNSSGSTLTFPDGDTLKWDNLSSTTVNLLNDGTEGNISYGMFDTTGVGSNTSTVPSGETFTLNVYQTAPSSTSFTDVATLTGMISSTGSSIILTFPTLNFMLGPDIFSISQPGPTALNPGGGFVIVPPNDDNGATTINGQAAMTTTPEPSTMILFGLGLISLSLIGRKRQV